MWDDVISLSFSCMHACTNVWYTSDPLLYLLPYLDWTLISIVASVYVWHTCFLLYGSQCSCSPLFRWHVANLSPSVMHNHPSSTAFRASPHLSSSYCTLPPPALQALSPSLPRPPGRCRRGAQVRLDSARPLPGTNSYCKCNFFFYTISDWF